MSETTFLRALLRHALVLTLGSVPAALFVFWLVRTALGQNGSAGLFKLTDLYPAIAWFTMPGALPYTLALAALALIQRRRGRASPGRRAVLLVTPVALLPWFLWPPRSIPLSWLPFALAISMGLIVLAVGTKLPVKQRIGLATHVGA